jgi:hypothetical protein
LGGGWSRGGDEEWCHWGGRSPCEHASRGWWWWGGGRAVTGTSPPEKGATPVEVGDLARARAGKVAKGPD